MRKGVSFEAMKLMVGGYKESLIKAKHPHRPWIFLRPDCRARIDCVDEIRIMDVHFIWTNPNNTACSTSVRGLLSLAASMFSSACETQGHDFHAVHGRTHYGTHHTARASPQSSRCSALL